MLHQEWATVKERDESKSTSLAPVYYRDRQFKIKVMKYNAGASSTHQCEQGPFMLNYRRTFLVTHSNAKKRPHVTTIRPSVRGRTPLCLARMIRPSQKNLFFPGNTSHFLRGRCAFFSVWFCADEGDTDSARGSICWYSQFFIM